MKPWLLVPLIVTALGSLSAVAGDERFEIEPRVATFHHANLFQATDGAPKRNVWSSVLKVRVKRTLDDVHDGLGAYGFVERRTFSDLATSGGAGGGIEMKSRPHAFRVSARGVWNRPVFFVGDDLATSNLFRIDGRYSYRLGRDLQLNGVFDYYRQKNDRAAALANHTVFVGGSVRYRGFGYRFSPEVGLRRGRQNTRDPNGDYAQTELLVKVRSAATARVYLSFRYRYRLRRYDTELASVGNFGRQDDRHAFRALTAIKLRPYLVLDGYFSMENADSLRTSRIFVTRTVGFGLTFLPMSWMAP